MEDVNKTADNIYDEAILAIKAIQGRRVPIDEEFLDSFEITYDTWTLVIEALELYKIAKRPNPDDLTETTIAQLTYDIERINTLRGDEWDYEPGAEEMRKELSAKYGHAINALMDYNKTVTVTWIGDPDDCPSAICSRCDRDLTIYDWYDKLVFGPRQYCPYCGGRIGKQVVREEYTGDDEWEEEV
jgi:DNA-directed RNA polymerase subunit RPC12/RpoP